MTSVSVSPVIPIDSKTEKMMQTRLLIFTLILLAAAITVPAQEETPVPDEPTGIEEQDEQAPATPPPGSNIEAPAETAPTAESEPGEPGLDTFRPSEEISADRSVAFPNDI